MDGEYLELFFEVEEGRELRGAVGFFKTVGGRLGNLLLL